MKSIIFLSVMNGASWGGSEEQWYQLALYYAKLKTRTTVVFFYWPQKEEKISALKEAGCQVHLLPQKSKSIFYKLNLRRELNQIPFHDYEFAYINQGGWEDVLHSPFKKLNKKLPPYILSFHNYQSGSKLSSTKLRLLGNWVENASLNISDANKTFEVLEKDFAINIPRKKVIYNPITFPVPSTASPYPQNETVKFIMLAALDVKRKAQDILIEVLSSIKWKERNWVLELYGEGPDQKFLEQFVQSKKLENKIILRGHTKQVQEVLVSANLVLQCTHIDAMPISVTEAMAMAKPCLVSNVGDMSLWVSDQNGFICHDVSIRSLDETLETAWQSKPLWENLGKEAFRSFKQMYPEPYFENLASVIEQSYTNPSHSQ